eukprot:TRINITY_DN8086_c0_g1_i1.p1 TRINITY_DN8086_c0_g1~~TRINITY_DN8086_c0_g1_i1.p1  ORF type:complete len:111 (-),score=78.36 TRINITY_DN8086_c0_g1_i1:28-360(-)
MIRRRPRSTQSRSSAASDVYKRQVSTQSTGNASVNAQREAMAKQEAEMAQRKAQEAEEKARRKERLTQDLKELLGQMRAVSYTHLRAHETVLDLVCRLLLEKKKNKKVHT